MQKICAECISLKTNLQAVKGMLCRLSDNPQKRYTLNPLTKEATEKAIKAGGFSQICQMNPWKYAFTNMER